ncbi:MAG: hypothetical protein DRJ56_06260 [Thermoprotei archaeon]|nr:MAG: hypothetical protein DRJ56_06260 [Thermoprotei archaeon]
MSGVAIPLASPVHRREYYEESLRALSQELKSLGFEVTGIVDSLGKAREVGAQHREDVVLLVFLTGGTSRLARAVIGSHRLHGVLGLCQGLHNSLPSAISAMARARVAGRDVVLYYCDEFRRPCTEELERLGRVASAISALWGMRVGVISDAEVGEARDFEERFGAKVERVGQDALRAYVEKAPPELVSEGRERLERALSLKETEVGKLARVLRVYAGIKKLAEDRGYTAVTVDCFPFIRRTGVTPCLALALLNSEGVVAACEADLTGTVLMLLARALTGRSGWMANPSAIRGNKLVLAHCTAALDLIEKGSVVTHFETGSPYSAAASFPGGTYTIASLSYDFRGLAISSGRLEESGMLSAGRCRTQAVFRLEEGAAEVLEKAPANHHIVMRGNVLRELGEIARVFGLRVLKYGG